MRSKKLPFRPVLSFSQCIWDKAPHNGLTDLIHFRGRWYCIFREGEHHFQGAPGTIRLISSSDTVTWSSLFHWQEQGADLRDPKLSITPEGLLMVLIVRLIYGKDKQDHSLQSYVTFSADGKSWSKLQPVLPPQEWLWRVTWYKEKAYGVAYRVAEDKRRDWQLTLYESDDAINFQLVADLMVPGKPNETTLRFTSTGEMIALVRRDSKYGNEAWIGYSDSPYERWEWSIASHHLGGPNFLILPDGRKVAAGRYLFITPYGQIEKTVIASLDERLSGPFLTLPSCGDCSYPGLVYHDDFLWVSYYSSHEGKAAIYFAKIIL
jgi:hypothetical protein